MKEEGVSTVVGSGVHLTGTLKDQSDIVVHGSVEGEVSSDQNVVVGDNAKIKGPVSAQVISISGEVKGTVNAKDKLEIHPSGRVEGNIKTKDLIIHSGAYFNGKSEMVTEAAESEASMVDMIAHAEEGDDENDDNEKKDEESTKIEIEEEN